MSLRKRQEQENLAKAKFAVTINSLLAKDTISTPERKFLLEAKDELNKNYSFERVVGDLQGNLTFLAMKNEISKDVGPLYLQITDTQFMDKGLGGLGMAFSSMFHA